MPALFSLTQRIVDQATVVRSLLGTTGCAASGCSPLFAFVSGCDSAFPRARRVDRACEGWAAGDSEHLLTSEFGLQRVLLGGEHKYTC